MAARKSDWARQLRQTRGPEALRECKPDEFPLDQVQPLTNPLLNSSPSALFGFKPIPPRSTGADDILTAHLALLGNEPEPGPFVLETAVIASLHLFSHEGARAYIRRWTKPDFSAGVTDQSFKSRISVYFQTIIIACRVGPCLVHEGEVLAARQLLEIVNYSHLGNRKDLPRVVRLLNTLTNTSCAELFPASVVSVVLRRVGYKENLEARLAALRRSHRWVEIHSHVGGLWVLSQRSDLPQELRRLLPEIFPDYPMWASWQPAPRRIDDWELRIESFQRAELGTVFDLEGPDTTLQQRAVLRFSHEGAFTNSRAEGPWNGKDILDHLLNLLDDAINIGPHAVDLFIHLCVQNPTLLRWRILHQLEAGLSSRQDSVAETLCDFLRALQSEVGTRKRTVILTSALNLFHSSPPLQKAYGSATDLPIRAPKMLSDAQRHFCSLLLESDPETEAFGLEVRFLGRALLNSHWLSSHWKPAYVRMLSSMPLEEEISGRFRAIWAARDSNVRQAHMDYLAMSLGASVVRDDASMPPCHPTTNQHSIWSTPLDPHRDALRNILHGMDSLSQSLATACLQAAEKEHDAFVREITSIICKSSDQACVNLARFLGPRTVRNKNSVADCWGALLLHMMRKRPEHMLERLAKELPAQSWTAWVENMSRLLGERHVGENGVPGFTEARMRQLTQWKMGLIRGGSTSSGSASSG
ncbi:hypothetical protein QBC42DRAFT_105524 [Cladorrhinum samala]|uniref:Uncharacterized protein n=1 Tax=Cladorrhinum samala TaxID=585594 RepID=A0AAV9HLA3_9PEZI|nr:hypothetical protein QBC42DRAFT_105524 [Cladorrhinum samala]